MGERGVKYFFPNVIIRGDVLQVLNRYCTVIYYPLDGERNNGFHISDIPDIKGKKQHFVFINTAQSIEKQVFTAAHELCHVWNIEKRVIEKLGIDIDKLNNQGFNSMEERIANRFAAELLMPEAEFRAQFEHEINELQMTKQGIPLTKFLRVVAFLMNFFLTPMKSVLIRMAELEILSADTVAYLVDEKNKLISVSLKREMERIYKEEGYTDLYKVTEKRYIEGLAEMLERAEKNGTVSQEKINSMREKFSLELESNDPELEKEIELG